MFDRPWTDGRNEIDLRERREIGNRYTVFLSLFDTQNVRSENKLTDYCRSEDELIELVQATLRKLLGEEMVSPPPPAQSKIGPPGQATGMPIAPPQATVVSMASFQSYNFRNHFIGMPISWEKSPLFQVS